MLKDTKSLGNNKAPACESRGFVHKKGDVHFDTPPFLFHYLFDYLNLPRIIIRIDIINDPPTTVTPPSINSTALGSPALWNSANSANNASKR